MIDLESIDEMKQPGLASPHSAFLSHTKCPSAVTRRIVCAAPESGKEGFFRLGSLRLFGRTGDESAALRPDEALAVIDSRITRNAESVNLPINPTEIIENLRWEKYAGSANTQISYISNGKSFSRRLYYAIRPLLPVNVRRHLQRRRSRIGRKSPFPNGQLTLRWRISSTCCGDSFSK